MPALINAVRIQGYASFSLANKYIEVQTIPALGGKINSIRDKRSGREWLWSNPYIPWRSPRYGASYIREYDSGGFDECFPTIDACQHTVHPWEGVSLPDHGEVFSQPWDVTQICHLPGGEARLSMEVSGVRLPYHFSRTIAIESEEPVLHLDYTILNQSSFDLPFIWCAHPIMKIESGMRVIFPRGTEAYASFTVGDSPVRAFDTFIWPDEKQHSNGLGVTPDPDTPGFKPFAVKLFTHDLPDGWAMLASPDGMSWFRFSFNLDKIRHIALWLNYAGWSGANTPPYYNMAFEPAIGACDALDIALRYQKCAAIISPKGKRTWRLTIELGDGSCHGATPFHASG